MITLVGSEVVARRPTDIGRYTTSETDVANKEAMPASRAPTEDADIGTYQPPVALTPVNRKNKARVTAEPARESSDNELEVVERSKIDVDMITMEGLLGLLEEKKKRSALTIANKVCTSFVIDLSHLSDGC